MTYIWVVVGGVACVCCEELLFGHCEGMRDIDGNKQEVEVEEMEWIGCREAKSERDRGLRSVLVWWMLTLLFFGKVV